MEVALCRRTIVNLLPISKAVNIGNPLTIARVEGAAATTSP